MVAVADTATAALGRRAVLPGCRPRLLWRHAGPLPRRMINKLTMGMMVRMLYASLPHCDIHPQDDRHHQADYAAQEGPQKQDDEEGGVPPRQFGHHPQVQDRHPRVPAVG